MMRFSCYAYAFFDWRDKKRSSKIYKKYVISFINMATARQKDVT